jgi:hypothetical protein
LFGGLGPDEPALGGPVCCLGRLASGAQVGAGQDARAGLPVAAYRVSRRRWVGRSIQTPTITAGRHCLGRACVMRGCTMPATLRPRSSWCWAYRSAPSWGSWAGRGRQWPPGTNTSRTRSGMLRRPRWAACCGADPEGQDATETELRQRRCSELTDPRAAAHRAWSERGGCGISNQRGHEPKPLSPATRIQEYPRRRNHAHLAVLERVLHPSEHRQLRPELRATAAMCGGKPWRPE